MSNYPDSVGLAFCMPLSGKPVYAELPLVFSSLNPGMNINCRYITIKGREIGYARNWLVQQAISQKCEFIFLLDEDVEPPAYAVRQLLYRMRHTPDAGMYVGVYCHKSHPCAPMLFRGNGHGAFWDWKLGETKVEVSGAGTGCAMIRLEVFSKLSYSEENPWFKTVDDTSAFLDDINHLEQWTEDIYFCFPAGSHVYGDNKPIENYKKNDLVLTHEGHVKSVTDTIMRDYKGDLFLIKPKYGGDFSLTPKHPVLISRNGKHEFVAAQNIALTDKLVVPIQSRIREDRTDYLTSFQFIRNKFVEFKNNKFSYTRTTENSQWFPLKVDVTPELSRLCGYWVFEGCVTNNKSTTCFTFNINEKKYTDDVLYLLKAVFDLEGNCIEYPEKSTRIVLCNSSALSDFFVGYFGDGAANKHVPEEICFGRLSCVQQFLIGYWRGDGSKTKSNHLRISTVSEVLAHNIRCMLIRAGLYPIINTYTRHDEVYPNSRKVYIVGVAAKYYEEYCNLLEEKSFSKKRKIDNGFVNKYYKDNLIVNGGYFEVAIDDITKNKFEGKVYNLTVEKDHTYNVNGFAVHNCNRLIKETDYKIYADCSILCNHVDPVSGYRYTLPSDSTPLLRMGVEQGKKKIVDLGCGEQPYTSPEEGVVVRVDAREEVHPDYRCDLRVLPFANEEFDVAVSFHVLEHFGRNEVEEVLREWTRILKPEGELRLSVPNLEWAAKKILEGVTDNNVYNVLYGQQDYDLNFHKYGFTPKVLEDLLRKIGYKTFDTLTEGYHLIMRATRGDVLLGKTVVNLVAPPQSDTLSKLTAGT